MRLWVGDTPLPPPIGALLVKNKNAYIKFISQSKWHRQESDLCNVDAMQGESIFDKRFASRIFGILGIFIPFCFIRVYFFLNHIKVSSKKVTEVVDFVGVSRLPRGGREVIFHLLGGGHFYLIIILLNYACYHFFQKRLFFVFPTSYLFGERRAKLL